MLHNKQDIARCILITNLAIFFTVLFLQAQNSTVGETCGYGQPGDGLGNTAFTIYTNPAQDCSTCMNISWATPPGVKCAIEVRDEETGELTLYEAYDGSGPDLDSVPQIYYESHNYRSRAFKDIRTKNRLNESVREQPVFDKHGYELFDLHPDREYSYRIVTYNDSTGQEEYSDRRSFITAGAKEWRAAVIGDFHHYSPLQRRVDAAMGMLDVLDSVADGFDWVLSTGDQVAAGGMYNCWDELSEQPYYVDFMWASVQGNHDQMALDNSVKTDDFFRDSHFFPYNGYEGQEGVSYWFRYGDVLFIMLNNEGMKSQESLLPALEWMERVVEQNPSKYVVVVEHHQWIIGQDGTRSQLERFYRTFDRLGVDLALSGHNHVYLRTHPLRDREPVEPEEGTVYVVTPSSDDSRGRDMKHLKDNRDLIDIRWSEGENTVGAMIMDVNPERIEMTLYDRYGEVQDSFIVPAKR